MTEAGSRVELMVQSVSPALARRIALAAQGFGRRSAATPGIRQLDALVNRVELLQIDSVNVFERSHYMPAARSADRRPRGPLHRVLGARGVVPSTGHLAAVRLADAALS